MWALLLQKVFAQIGGTNNMRILAQDCLFRNPMAGDHSGSEFYDCDFEQGWVPDSDDTPATVSFFGGQTKQPFDFQTDSIDTKQWQFHGFKLQGVSAILKFHTLVDCIVDIIGGTSVETQFAIDIDNSIRSTEIRGAFKSPPNAGAVINIVLADGSVQSDGVKISCTFKKATSTTNPASRFIKVAGAGTALGWHIDCSEARSGVGDFLEDIVGAVSVEMANAVGCKFTLVPNHIMEVLISAGSDNVVDSGVVNPGSIGTTKAVSSITKQHAHAVAVR